LKIFESKAEQILTRKQFTFDRSDIGQVAPEVHNGDLMRELADLYRDENQSKLTSSEGPSRLERSEPQIRTFHQSSQAVHSIS
jgi:hypothetical protein